MDMLVNLYQLPPLEQPAQARICRVLPPDASRVLEWVAETFGAGWRSECQTALAQQPPTCYIAQQEGRIVGFACYDATAKGYFGPIGVSEALRGSGIGRALLIHTLHGMKEAGYGYAVIGWCDHAQDFYRRVVGAIPIPGSDAGQTVYGRLCRFSVPDGA